MLTDIGEDRLESRRTHFVISNLVNRMEIKKH
jgi:hypothetical protein